MPEIVSDSEWTEYKRLFNEDFKDTFVKGVCIWRKQVANIDRHGEGNSEALWEEKVLECLMDYNQFHKWPINATTASGELDRMNAFMYLNRSWLESEGLLTASGNFDFGSRYNDRFIIQDIVYKCFGETELAQEQVNPIWLGIILQRQETMTGDEVDSRNAGVQT